jgi:K+-sensing histidine kinase KdpD
LKVSVKDSGCTITPDKQATLFELFGEGIVSQDDINQHGVGLGLSVSKMICKLLKGDLFLDWSIENVGSKFSFYLPVV